VSVIRVHHGLLFGLLVLDFIRIKCDEKRKWLIYDRFVSSFLLPPLAWKVMAVANRKHGER